MSCSRHLGKVDSLTAHGTISVLETYDASHTSLMYEGPFELTNRKETSDAINSLTVLAGGRLRHNASIRLSTDTLRTSIPRLTRPTPCQISHASQNQISWPNGGNDMLVLHHQWPPLSSSKDVRARL